MRTEQRVQPDQVILAGKAKGLKMMKEVVSELPGAE